MEIEPELMLMYCDTYDGAVEVTVGEKVRCSKKHNTVNIVIYVVIYANSTETISVL